MLTQKGYLLLFSLLGFISGLPLMLVGSTLQAWGTEYGLSLSTLGLLTLIGQPYAFKFLWAPLLDRYYMPFWHGHRRGCILGMALLLSFSIFLLSRVKLPHQLINLVFFSTITAFFSATFDIAVDAYRTDLLPKEQYGLGNASYVSAYRIGMLVSGGLALVLADQIGWHLTYQLMAVLVLIGFLIAHVAPEPQEININTHRVSWVEHFIAPLKNLWQREYIVVILIFIVLYKFGEAMGTALSTTFLLRELHFSLSVVGGAYKTVGLVATIIGAFVGGLLYKKYSLYRTLLWFGFLQALGILLYAWLAATGQHFFLMLAAVSMEALTAGMATTVFLALLMQLCRQPYTATHFALLSACASLGRIFTGPLASTCVKYFTWEGYFVISFLISLPALFLLMWLKPYLDRL
jgi:PAT family beta-lactamase induction signal transducer AmpG